jgi:hypothetical protein
MLYTPVGKWQDPCRGPNCDGPRVGSNAQGGVGRVSALWPASLSRIILKSRQFDMLLLLLGLIGKGLELLLQ